MGISSPRVNYAVQSCFLIAGPQLGGRSKYKLVSSFHSESNAIAVGQDFCPCDLVAVDEDTAALTTVLDLEAARHSGNHQALARDVRVVQSQVVSAFAAPPDKERQFADGDHPTWPVSGHDLDIRIRRRNKIRH